MIRGEWLWRDNDFVKVALHKLGDHIQFIDMIHRFRLKNVQCLQNLDKINEIKIRSSPLPIKKLFFLTDINQLLGV